MCLVSRHLNDSTRWAESFQKSLESRHALLDANWPIRYSVNPCGQSQDQFGQCHAGAVVRQRLRNLPWQLCYPSGSSVSGLPVSTTDPKL